jgi:hypothetical protein
MRMMRVFAKWCADAQTNGVDRTGLQGEIQVEKSVVNIGHQMRVWKSRSEGRRTCVISAGTQKWMSIDQGKKHELQNASRDCPMCEIPLSTATLPHSTKMSQRDRFIEGPGIWTEPTPMLDATRSHFGSISSLGDFARGLWFMPRSNPPAGGALLRDLDTLWA